MCPICFTWQKREQKKSTPYNDYLIFTKSLAIMHIMVDVFRCSSICSQEFIILNSLFSLGTVNK